MSNLSPQEKLRALGVKSPSAQNNPYLQDFQAIEDAKTFSQFTTDVNNQSSFSEFETYLTDTIGLSSSRASNFRSRMEQKYASFSDFQSALSGFSTYDEWINSFSWGTTLAGDPVSGENEIVAGVRIHGEDGVSKDGVLVPKGTLELFGPRIEFSQAPAPIDASASFSTTNLTISDTTPFPGQTITIEADVTNNSGYSLNHTSKLTEDGDVVRTKTLSYGAGETKTVSFSRTYEEFEYHDVKVNEAGPTAVSVVPPNLI